MKREEEREGETESEKRRGEATAIPDFHFNWTQRNIILNARNASETPIKRRRHFTLSPCTFVLIAGPIVAEVAIDYSSPEISRRSARHVRRLAATGFIYIFRREIACRRRWIARDSPRTNFVPRAFNAELTSPAKLWMSIAPELCGKRYKYSHES